MGISDDLHPTSLHLVAVTWGIQIVNWCEGEDLHLSTFLLAQQIPTQLINLSFGLECPTMASQKRHPAPHA